MNYHRDFKKGRVTLTVQFDFDYLLLGVVADKNEIILWLLPLALTLNWEK